LLQPAHVERFASLQTIPQGEAIRGKEEKMSKNQIAKDIKRQMKHYQNNHTTLAWISPQVLCLRSPKGGRRGCSRGEPGFLVNWLLSKSYYSICRVCLPRYSSNLLLWAGQGLHKGSADCLAEGQ